MAATVNFVWNSDRPATWVSSWVRSSFATVLGRWGYRVEGTTQESIRFVRRRSFRAVALISPLAFLISPDQKEEVVVTVMATGTSASRMIVLGELPKKIAAALDRLPQVQRDEADNDNARLS